jgi:hypothetical protein
MLLAEPLGTFMSAQDTAFGPAFTLKEGIVLGRKPR